MRELELAKAFTLIEPGPVVLVTTHDGKKHNIMTISWTMVMDFTPVFAITTGAWNHSYAALQKIPGVRAGHSHGGHAGQGGRHRGLQR